VADGLDHVPLSFISRIGPQVNTFYSSLPHHYVVICNSYPLSRVVIFNLPNYSAKRIDFHDGYQGISQLGSTDNALTTISAQSKRNANSTVVTTSMASSFLCMPNLYQM
jgi:hypothetical protein